MQQTRSDCDLDHRQLLHAVDIDFHTLRFFETGRSAQERLLIGDIVALNTSAQWRHGEESHPPAIRRIAGTLTEIGNDYFAHGPGVGRLAGNSPTKLLLTAVLNALEGSTAVSGKPGLEMNKKTYRTHEKVLQRADAGTSAEKHESNPLTKKEGA